MRRKILAATAAAALAMTSACGDDGGSTADGQKNVTVGVIPIVDTAPLHLGVEQKFFSKRGINVKIENTTGGAAAVPGVISGNFQFAFGNITSLVVARDKKLPLKIVANGVATTGEDGKDFGAVVVPKGSKIASPKDLKGAKVAVNNLKNIGDTTVRNSVREDGGDPKDIEFIELAFPDMPAALENGQVDAAWILEPFLTQALKDGATEIASNYVDASPKLTVAAYFTSEKVIADDPELVSSFTAAMNESLAYADAHPEEVRRILGTYTKIDPALIQAIRLPRFPKDVDRGSVETLADLMVQDGLIKKKPDLDELFR